MPFPPWFALALLLAPRAQAHPFEGDLYGHEARLRLAPDRLELRWRAEVPTREVLADAARRFPTDRRPTDAEKAEFTELWLAELADGLELRRNGEAVPLVRLANAEPTGMGDARFIRYDLIFEARYPPDGPQQLVLLDHNHADSRVVRQTDLVVHPDLRLDACSLWGKEGVDPTESRLGQWSSNPEDRELRLSFVAHPSWSPPLRRLGVWLGATPAPDLQGWWPGDQAAPKAHASAHNRAFSLIFLCSFALLAIPPLLAHLRRRARTPSLDR